MELGKLVWDFSTSRNLLGPGDRVVVGVSGGPDSLCLLDVLWHLSARHRLELHVAHLNHGLRPEAADEAAFVRQEAEHRGCACSIEVVDTHALAAARRLSLEAAAREARYGFLYRVARRVSAGLVAVAHTADDQAETVLIHLLRGSGLRGLGGMRPKRSMGEQPTDPMDADATAPLAQSTQSQLPVFLIRPLLSVTRRTVLAYCAEHNLQPRLDSSNLDVRFRRNRVRNELLPALEAYNPNIRSVLARTAEAMAGDHEVWRGAVQQLWREATRSSTDEAGLVAFDRKRWLRLSRGQQRALLRMAAARLLGHWRDIALAPMDAAVDFSRRVQPGRKSRVLRGLVLRVESDQISLLCEAGTRAEGDWPQMVDGELAPRWNLSTEVLGPGAWSHDEVAAAPRWTAYVDAAQIVKPVSLRARKPGDRFRPLGLAGHTAKLSDFLVNAKVPVRLRDQWPLATCGDDIVWVVGLRLDERFKVGPASQTVLRLSVSWATEE